jgi:rod shape-determining protein MreD
MNRFWGYFFLAILLIVQVIPQFRIYGFFPDLLMIFVLAYSFTVGVTSGIIFGAILGLVVDILSSAIIGTHIVVFATAAYLVEVYSKVFVYESIFTLPVVSFLTTFVKYIVLFLESVIFHNISLANVWLVMLIEAPINFVFAFPMVWVSNRIISLIHGGVAYRY